VICDVITLGVFVVAMSWTCFPVGFEVDDGHPRFTSKATDGSPIAKHIRWMRSWIGDDCEWSAKLKDRAYSAKHKITSGNPAAQIHRKDMV